MFSFFSFFAFFMSVASPSRRSTSSKAFVESQMAQHLPKSAQTLVSPLSEDDREVLHYMLAFGLHLQMVAGLVNSSSNLEWRLWKAPSVKVGLRNEHSYVSLSSQSVTGKSWSGPQKVRSRFAHKPSGSCDCFSCYSSFWSRWAASPNRDLLNTIIDMAEMADIGEEPRACKGKEKKKKQEKKCVAVQEAWGKKAKSGNWKLQNTPKTRPFSSASVNMHDARTDAEVLNETSGCTSMDAISDALWDSVSVSKDEASHVVAHIWDGSVMLTENSAELNSTVLAKNDLLPRTEKNKNLRPDMDSTPQTLYSSSSKEAEVSALAVGKGGGISLKEASLSERLFSAPMQGDNNLKLQGLGKRKSNQIAPVFPEGTFVLAAEDHDSSVCYERGEMPVSEGMDSCHSFFPTLYLASLLACGIWCLLGPDTDLWTIFEFLR